MSAARRLTLITSSCPSDLMAIMPVRILMVEAGWRGLSGALAQMVSPVAASMTMKLFELT